MEANNTNDNLQKLKELNAFMAIYIENKKKDVDRIEKSLKENCYTASKPLAIPGVQIVVSGWKEQLN